MRDLIKKELIEDADSYLIIHNGEVIEHSAIINDLMINQNIELKVIHIIDKNTKINYEIGSNLNIKIEEIFYSIKNDPQITININVKDGTSIDFLSFKKSDNSTVSAIVNTNLEKNTYINIKNLSIFSSTAQVKQSIYLNGINAKLDMKNVFVNSSSQIQNNDIDIYHNIESTFSDMKNYGICNNNSTLNIRSNGIIKKGAKLTELRQKAKGLILDLNSQISANPVLEIGDFDCIANHGASIGAIDEEELYYLMSRGLSKLESEKLIVSGFIVPFLVEIKEGKLQDYLMSWLNINV